MRILLNHEDFVALTKGDIIEKDGVKIALSDIGYDAMMDIIEKHQEKSINNNKQSNDA